MSELEEIRRTTPMEPAPAMAAADAPVCPACGKELVDMRCKNLECEAAEF